MIPQNGQNKWNFKKAKWDEFYIHTTKILPQSNFQNVQSATDYFNEKILEAAMKFIPYPVTKLNKPSIPWWNGECQMATERKKMAYRRFRRSKQDNDWVEYKHARAQAKRTLRAARHNTWHQYVSSISSKTPLATIWNKVRKMKHKYTTPERTVL